MSDIRETLKQYAELQEKATEGEWRSVHKTDFDNSECGHADVVGPKRGKFRGIRIGEVTVTNEDGDFIAAARNLDLAAVLNHIDESRALLRRSLAIIVDAIMHGMPVSEEVADVRNQIVAVCSGFRECGACGGSGIGMQRHVMVPRPGFQSFKEDCTECRGAGVVLDEEGGEE